MNQDDFQLSPRELLVVSASVGFVYAMGEVPEIHWDISRGLLVRFEELFRSMAGPQHIAAAELMAKCLADGDRRKGAVS